MWGGQRPPGLAPAEPHDTAESAAPSDVRGCLLLWTTPDRSTTQATGPGPDRARGLPAGGVACAPARPRTGLHQLENVPSQSSAARAEPVTCRDARLGPERHGLARRLGGVRPVRL